MCICTAPMKRALLLLLTTKVTGLGSNFTMLN